MSLVAYESSSESEDDSPNEGAPKLVSTVPVESQNVNGLLSFCALPPPKHVGTDTEEEQDEFLTKKEVLVTQKPVKLQKLKIKIGIPSLAQFDSDDDTKFDDSILQMKVDAPGLFAILPLPKGSPTSVKSFIPNVITRNGKILVPAKHTKPTAQTVIPRESDDKNDSSDGEELDALAEPYDDETWRKLCGKRKRRPNIVPTIQFLKPVIIEAAPEASKPYSGLDNFAFKELMGSSKRKKYDIHIIDITQDEILPDKDLWLTKTLTDPEFAPKPVITDPINGVSKRKHHITYLAQQAKENEQELKNQWAQNRMSRKQTQSKYGF